MTFSAGGHPVKVITTAKSLITDAVSLSLTGSNVKVEYGLPDDLWEVEVDETQIRQALSSITVNAKEAMPGGGTIRVTAENVEQGPPTQAPNSTVEKVRFVKVIIADCGRGIPRKTSPRYSIRIFPPNGEAAIKGWGSALP